MAKRKSMSKRKRFEVFKRDAFTCQYCGRNTPQVVLEIDHVIAVASGGDDEPENLLTACFDCNSGKSDRPLTEAMPSMSAKMADEKERQAQLSEYNAHRENCRTAKLEAIERMSDYWFSLVIKPFEGRWLFGAARTPSIKSFLQRMPEADIKDAMDIAHGKFPLMSIDSDDWKTWKYFCGVCWNMIKEAG